MRDWKVTVKIGNRVMVWTLPGRTKEEAKKYAQLQLKHRGGTVVKVEEA